MSEKLRNFWKFGLKNQKPERTLLVEGEMEKNRLFPFWLIQSGAPGYFH